MSKTSLGFKLSGNKRKKIVNTEDESKETKEEIKSIEGNVVKSLVNKVAKAELVIPLPAPLNPDGVYVSVKSKEKVKKISEDEVNSNIKDNNEKKELSIDELAAQEILQDLNGKSQGDSAPLVIKSAGREPEDSEGNDNNNVMKKAPLLMANIAPELFGIEDDDKRFKVDVELRADNMDVNSDAYVNIPIGDFGAAMLRGMGWSGPTEEDEAKDKYTVVPRDYRLGLGATPKPPDEKTRGKSKAEKEKEKNKWQKKAEEQLKKQNLQVGSLVWLRSPAFVGKRAEVTAVAGVPGLNKISVALEETGEEVHINKLDAVLLSEGELKDIPFQHFRKQSEIPPESGDRKRKEKDVDDMRREKKRNRHDDDYKRNRERDDERDNHRDRKRDRDKARDSSKDRGRERTKYDDKNSDSKSSDRQRKKYNDNVESENCMAVAPTGWVRQGIRVKIISKKVGDGKYYLQKGTVVDVYFSSSSSSSSKFASVRMDAFDNCVQEVKEKYMETVLPSEGGSCVILTGEFAGSAAILIEKNKKKNTVCVQLVDDMDIITVGMDDIAAVA